MRGADPLRLCSPNDSFSVGGSISVNCHGWQFDRAPISSSVDSFTLMKADGELVTCSRERNRELFSLVLGGYGLFGIIIDVNLHVVENKQFRIDQFIIKSKNALEKYNEIVLQDVLPEFLYARFNIVPESLFNEIIINALYINNGEEKILPIEEPGMVKIRSSLFRGSEQSELGKKIRWAAETKLQPMLSGSAISRNTLLNEGVEVFANTSSSSVDILHEYFIPDASVTLFIQELKGLILNHECDLLNVTIRSVNKDVDTYLKYADQHMFAFVMLFNQPISAAAEKEMRVLTQEIIDLSLKLKGRYYLPYRLHATKEQFHESYPMAKSFFKAKLEYDPREVFQNEFYKKYAGYDGEE